MISKFYLLTDYKYINNSSASNALYFHKVIIMLLHFGNSPLYNADNKENPELVSPLIIENGADINKKFPLMLAISFNNFDLVHLFIRNNE